jgi:hypothetical protein
MVSKNSGFKYRISRVFVSACVAVFVVLLCFQDATFVTATTMTTQKSLAPSLPSDSTISQAQQYEHTQFQDAPSDTLEAVASNTGTDNSNNNNDDAAAAAADGGGDDGDSDYDDDASNGNSLPRFAGERQQFWGKIKEAASSVGNAFKKGVSAVKKHGSALLNKAKTHGTNLWNSAKKHGTNLLNKAKATGKNLWNSAKTAGKNIATAAGNAWNAAKTHGKNLLNKAKTHGKNLWNAAKTHGKNLWNAAKKHGKNLWDKAKTHGKNLWNAAKKHGKNLWDKAKKHGKNLWNAAKNVGKKLVDAGRKALGLPRPPPTNAGGGKNTVPGGAAAGGGLGNTGSTQPLFDRIQSDVEKPLAPRPASDSKPGRKMDPNFDKLDIPENCPQKCNGHGKCLIDREAEPVTEGNVKAYPYKCHCHPMWFGESCESYVDQFSRWFESKGQTEYPPCCNVCSSQFQNPHNYNDLPVFQNPFSVSNCDPRLSIDSRPDDPNRPPCYRPLHILKTITNTEDVDEDSGTAAEADQQREATEERNERNRREESSLLQEQDVMLRQHQHLETEEEMNARLQRVIDTHKRAQVAESFDEFLEMHAEGRVERRTRFFGDMISAAKEALQRGLHHVKKALGFATPAKDDKPKHLQGGATEDQKKAESSLKPAETISKAEEEAQRLNFPVTPCCIYCEFDFWSQANSRPPRPRPSARGVNYIRALERQRIAERMGVVGMVREQRRREWDRRNQEQSFWLSHIGFNDGRDPANFVEVEETSRHRNHRSRVKNAGNGQSPKPNPMADNPGARSACCEVCPVPAEPPQDLEGHPMKLEKTTDEKDAAAKGLKVDRNYNVDKYRAELGFFLRRGKRRTARACCNHCPSQFWLRPISQDSNPFWGAEKHPPPRPIEGTAEENASPDMNMMSGTAPPAETVN